MTNEKNLTITEEKDKCKINIINQINNTQFSINIPIKKKRYKIRNGKCNIRNNTIKRKK